MYKIKATIFILILATSSFLSENLKAQTEDFNLWTSIEIEKKVTNNLKMGVEFSNRLMNNLSQRDESFVDLGLAYKVNNFDISVNYRFSNRNDLETNYSFANRFYGGISYKNKIARFRTSFRLKYQQQYEDWSSSENGNISENYLRARLKLGYDILGFPMEPYISYETFQGMNNTDLWILQKHRYSFGIKYNINKLNSLSLVLHRQQELNQSRPSNKSILSISYGLEIK